MAHSYGFLRASVPAESAKVHYNAGIAYEEAGLVAEAIAAYEEFLTIWMEPDPELLEPLDARAMLDRLRSGS